MAFYKKKLPFFYLFFFISCLTVRAESLYQQTILASNPFGYYRLSETSGAAINLGSIGSIANGSYQGTPSRGIAGALINDSDAATGFSKATQNYVNMNALTGHMIDGNDFSFEAWFKTTDVPAGNYQNVIFSSNGSPSENIFRVGTGVNGGIYLSTSGGDYQYGSGFNNGQWHHLVVSLPGNGSGTKIYVDNVLIATMTFGAASWSSSNRFSISAEYDATTPTDFFNGQIDEVALYKKILSSSEVDLHYSMGVNPVPEAVSILLFLCGLCVLFVFRYGQQQ